MKKKSHLKLYAICIFLFISNINFGYAIESNAKHNSLELLQQKKDSTLYKLYQKADSLLHVGQDSLSLQVAYLTLDRAIDENSLELNLKVNDLIGRIWFSTKSYKKAISYFKKGIEVYSKSSIKEKLNEIDDSIKVSTLERFYNVGKSYHLLQDSFITDDFEIEEKKKIYNDSLKYFYNYIIDFDSDNKKVLILKSKVYNNLSGFYMREGKLYEAEDYGLKALEIKKKHGDSYMLAIAYNAMSNISFLKKYYEESQYYLFKALDYLEGDSSVKADKIRIDLYSNVAYTLYLRKDFRAYQFLEKSNDLKEKLESLNKETKLAEVYAERNFQKGMEQGIFQEELKRQRVEFERQRAQRNTWVISISSLFIILLLIFFLNQNKLRQKNLSLELSKKETESQVEVLNASIAGEEKERKRISQELHDGVLGRLFGSRMGLGYLGLESDSERQNQYQKYLEELQSIEKEIRTVSHKLNNDVNRSEASFINAIHQLLKQKEHLGDFEFKLNVKKNFTLGKHNGEVQMHLFRILQECLQNIVKHAKAKSIILNFKNEKNALAFQIKDDGIGFDTTRVSKGIGLKNIKSRVEELEGELSLTSDKNKGTLINIRIPID
ncbi:MAG: sensor histidine kinase [Flavobacteriaceae bacterium]